MKTVSQLEKNWWWRKCDFEGLVHGRLWKEGFRWAAWHWELLRRSEGADSLPPYHELNDWQAFELCNLFGKTETPWIEISGANKSERGYSDPSIWPLKLPINTLKKRFVNFILEQRQKYKVVQHSKAAETSKPPSWRLVEALDIDRHGIRKKAFLRGLTLRDYRRANKTAKQSWEKIRSASLPSFAKLLSK